MKQVYKSDYLEGRRHNKTLYARLISHIEKNLENELAEQPNLTIELCMSAKYQAPNIHISENDQLPANVGTLEAGILDALNEVGFEYEDSEDKGYGYYTINFAD